VDRSPACNPTRPKIWATDAPWMPQFGPPHGMRSRYLKADLAPKAVDPARAQSVHDLNGLVHQLKDRLNAVNAALAKVS
jgi:hypothetical protein